MDYVLMNGDAPVLPCISYRDDRTEKAISKAHEIIPFEELYSRTGILTGVKAHEYTNATTTGLVNAKTKRFDKEIIQKLGLPEALFTDLHAPGTRIGKLSYYKIPL